MPAAISHSPARAARVAVCTFGAAILALTACGSAAALPIRLKLSRYIPNSGLRTVEVTVNGHESPFILDTGAGATVLTPQEIRHAGCKPFGKVTQFRAQGGKVTSSRCGPVKLAIGGYQVDRDVQVFDLGRLLGKAPPVGGILGLASFWGRAVTLDLAHDRLTIESRRSLARRIRAMRPIRVRITRDQAGAVVPFIEVRARTGTLWLEVDSGNDGPVFLAPHAQRQLAISIPPRAQRPLGLDVIGLGRVPVSAASRRLIFDGELDPAFLRQIVLTIDLRHGRAWARFDQPPSKTLY
ncbi:MAG: hypothetical protein HIU85_08580 [Proteobacteria bacterium]|nr:hypothetical protein [Pseudomonadota bacterium]